MGPKVLCYCAVLLCSWQCASSFNLEPRIPVIKTGRAGSYFGYSVAEHITQQGGSSVSWLLVGAPQDQNLQPNTTRSGALWKCPVTTSVGDCEQVVTDGKKYSNSEQLFVPHPDEIKEDQWLGVSVKSQGPGKSAVVCAHRYVVVMKNQTRVGQGLCYTLNNTLHMFENWEPCRGLGSQDHQDYGFCQAGISSEMLEDNSLIIGSPGPFTWRGTIFHVDANEDIIMRSQDTLKTAEDQKSPVAKYSYLGMSVTGAKFFNNDEYSYAAGAPRSQSVGQVIIFSKPKINDYEKDTQTLNVNHVIDGEQFGASFGYEIEAADVNGDGKPDLLVGAPFYFESKAGGAVYLYLNYDHTLRQEYDVKLTGKYDSQFGMAIANAGDLNKDGCDDIAVGSPYEGNGVVYIYMGNRKQGLKTVPDQIIRSEVMPKTIRTFGQSLSGGIDVDNNGYPDLLVGAFESASIALIRTRPIIDIQTEIIPNIIKGINASKHGCDKDPSAEYTCFHFQACYTITSMADSLPTTSHKVNYVIEAETFPGGKKFSRVFFETASTSNKSNVINQTIVLQKAHCKMHIVYLKNNTRDIQTPIKFSLTYQLVLPEPKYSSSGRLPNIDQYPVVNATSTTIFTATFLNDCGSDGVCISDLVVTPKLLLPMAEGDSKYALTLGKQEEVSLEVAVDNLGETAYAGQLIVEHHRSLQFIAVNMTDKHVICTTYNDTIVTCMLDNPFKKQPSNAPPIVLRFDAQAVSDTEQSLAFTVWANSTSTEKYPGKKPVTVEAVVIKNAELSIKGVARPEQLFYGGEVKGESAMEYFDQIGSRVVHTYQVLNEGPWKVSSLHVEILWPYQVASDSAQGKWLLYLEELPTVELEGDPTQGNCFVPDGNVNPLNVTSRPGFDALENLEMDPFLDIKKNNKHSKKQEDTIAKNYQSAAENKVRRKRETEDMAKAEAYTEEGGQRKPIINLNCHNNTAKCIRIHCLVYRLKRMFSATITVKARLWNSTLVEDYPRVAHVDIESSAVITMSGDNFIHQTKVSDDSASVTTIAYPDLNINETPPVPLWVIIVAVLLGLMVLVLLIIALWKLGFFKRSRPDPTLSGNLEKNNHEASPFIVRENRNSLR